MKKIDLNCDLGEVLLSSGQNTDERLMPYISSCNIATGGHAGDEETMEFTIANAMKHQIAIGAHPGYPDKENFGRKSIDISLKQLRDSLEEQILSFREIVSKSGASIHHIKAHGAFYNDLIKDNALAEMFILLVKEIDPKLDFYGLANTQLATKVQEEGMRFIHEIFGDRAYDSIVELRNRQLEGAVLDKMELLNERLDALTMHNSINLYNGTLIPTKAETMCFHSDTKNSLILVKYTKEYFELKNIEVART